MTDALSSARRFRTLNIVDDYTRECLAIEVDTSLGGGRVVRVLEELKVRRGLPRKIRELSANLHRSNGFLQAKLVVKSRTDQRERLVYFARR